MPKNLLEQVCPTVNDSGRTPSAWAHETSLPMAAVLRDIGEQIRVCALARQLNGGDRELRYHEARLIRRWAILESIHEDLGDPKRLFELYAARFDIERLIAVCGLPGDR